MRATGIMANLRVADIEAAQGFYTGYLGLSTEELNMGGVARYLFRHQGERPTRHARRNHSRRLGHFRPHG
jgi:catechol 2,3-dioxygenase-like lactoylglutathione lyase family enzyme